LTGRAEVARPFGHNYRVILRLDTVIRRLTVLILKRSGVPKGHITVALQKKECCNAIAGDSEARKWLLQNSLESRLRGALAWRK
jgi:hypothetical protein